MALALLSMHVPEPETPPDLEHQDPAPETVEPGEAVEAGRGFGQGHVFDAGGALVASFAQECMIRPIVAR